ncbi:tetratricopeptide repeat protein, partial [Thermodesulfobacteriota bacterium]
CNMRLLVAISSALAIMLAWSTAIASESADDLFNKGFEMQKALNEKQALEYYKRCLKKNPQHYKALLATGLAFYGEGDYGKARVRFREILDTHPGDLRARLYLAATKLQLGQAQDARDDFQKILADWPENVAARVGLGWSEYAMGDRFSAVDDLKKALARDKSNKSLARAISALEAGNKQYLKDEKKAKGYKLMSDLNNAIVASQIQAERQRKAAQDLRLKEGTPLLKAWSLFSLVDAEPQQEPDERAFPRYPK